MILPTIWQKRLVLVGGFVPTCGLLMIQCIKSLIQLSVSLRLSQPILRCWHHSSSTLLSGRKRLCTMVCHPRWQRLFAWQSMVSGLLISFKWLPLREIYVERSYSSCILWLVHRQKFETFLSQYYTTVCIVALLVFFTVDISTTKRAHLYC